MLELKLEKLGELREDLLHQCSRPWRMLACHQRIQYSKLLELEVDDGFRDNS